MIDKLMRLFQAHLLAKHDLIFYPYQLEVARRIFVALIRNLRLTSNALPEDIEKLKQEEIPIEFSRQSGKTTTIVHVVDFIMIFFPKIFDRKIEIGIFAPQKEQVKTDFDRLKNALGKSSKLVVIEEDKAKEAKEESNARTIVIPNGKGSSCYVFPVTKTSKPESKTLDLIVFEESQDLDDNIVKEQIWPMGKFTNAPRIYIGTAGTQICHFYRLTQQKEALVLDFDKIAIQKRQAYEQTGNPIHLIYIQSVKQDIEKFGRDADEIRRPYYLEWIIGTGMFITQEDLENMIDRDRKQTYHFKKGPCFAGIDTAKHPDSTVGTIIRWLDVPIRKTVFTESITREVEIRKQLLNWIELRGENYQNQFDILTGFDSSNGKMTNQGFLSNYNVLGVSIDSTGQGDFMPDMFESHTEWSDENSGLYRVKFSAVSKDNIYKNLKVTIEQLLTSLPNLSTKHGEKFREQMLDLQKEYKGQLLSVHHPDDPDAHDDYPDSWALAEWACAKYFELNNVDIQVLEVAKKERKAVRNADNVITDYWPGENF